ncbi:hypothetical protein [Thermomonas flagellata]|uniref:hypothetical protein n=1 Tax=Thermomonas flagellata TaxID=2888524 RepID=UPI001F03F1E4|nr:hypothetical protein [Thermomonas flagellata]
MNAPTIRHAPDPLTVAAAALLGLTLLFMVQGYFGIDHDAVLYLGEALRLRLPGILDRDLFFVHGSQGQYTLFPHLVAWALDRIDAGALFLWGTAVGLLFFAAASWYALRSLLPSGQRWLPWMALLCLPTAYGAYRIFGYAEPYFTPRLYAEPLCLLAIALLTRRHWARAAACLLLAALLHPLQALAAVLIAWLWLLLGDRRWLHVLWALPILAALGLVGVRPFSGLFLRMDPAMQQLAHEVTGQLFLDRWRTADLQAVGFDAAVLLYAARQFAGDARRWSMGALLGLGLALLANLVLVDVLRLALPAGLQFWRVHWLAHWFAMAWIGVLLQRDTAARDWPRLGLLALALTLAYGVPGWSWVPVALVYAGWPRLQPRLRPVMRVLLGGAAALAVLLVFFDYLGQIREAFRLARFQLLAFPFDRALFTFPAVTLAVVLGLGALWRRSGRVVHSALLVLLLPFAAYAGLRWDSRPALHRALEAHSFQPELFGPVLPESAQVYWEQASSVANWLVINRADYYSPQQLSGLVFSPGAAQDARARMDRMRPLREEADRCMLAAASSADSSPPAPCQISDAAMRQACAPSADSPPPDYLVLPYRQPQPARGAWSFRDPLATPPVRTFWLYACRDILAATPAVPPRGVP